MSATSDMVMLVGHGIGGGQRRRHEREDEMQRCAAEKGETVDVAEVHFAGEEEEGAEKEEEEDWTSKVRVIHYVLVDAGEGIEDCESLSNTPKQAVSTVFLSPSHTTRTVV